MGFLDRIDYSDIGRNDDLDWSYEDMERVWNGQVDQRIWYDEGKDTMADEVASEDSEDSPDFDSCYSEGDEDEEGYEDEEGWGGW